MHRSIGCLQKIDIQIYKKNTAIWLSENIGETLISHIDNFKFQFLQHMYEIKCPCLITVMSSSLSEFVLNELSDGSLDAMEKSKWKLELVIVTGTFLS